MSTRMLSRIAVMALLIMTAAVPAQAYIPYDTHVMFLGPGDKRYAEITASGDGLIYLSEPL